MVSRDEALKEMAKRELAKRRSGGDAYGKTGFAQATSGLNEGIANTLGFPVDMANMAIGLGMKGVNAVAGTDFQPSAEPLGGSAGLKKSLSGIGAIRPETDDPAQQAMRRVSQEVGSAVIPGLGASAKAEAPAREVVKLLAAALGSGAGAAAANQIAPDNALADMAGQLVGGLAVGGPIALASRAGEKKAIQAAVPSPEDLRSAKDAAYKRVDDIGATYTPEAMSDLTRGIKDEVTSSGIDDILNPRASRAMQIIEKRLDGNPQTLSELDRLRQFVRDNVVDVPGQKIEGRFAGKMIDNIDEFVDSAGPGQISTGNAAEAGSTINQARELNTRLRKYEMVTEALDRAERRAGSTGSGGNIDNATRQKIAAILDSPKKSRGLSPIEKEMMERVATGTKPQNFARQIGKLSPSGNGLQQALAIGATAVNPLMGVLPGTGAVAKALADRATNKNVEQLIRTILAGAPIKKAQLMNDSTKRIVGALLAAQGANAMAD